MMMAIFGRFSLSLSLSFKPEKEFEALFGER